MKPKKSLSDIFFYLLRLGLGLDTPRELSLSADEWRALLALAKKQAMQGILFAGVERLPANSMPPRDIAMKLYAVSLRIRKSNADLDRMCGVVTERLASVGLDSCVLKGQGVAKYYPDPTLRQPGDIDTWVRPFGITGRYDADVHLPGIIEKLDSLHCGKIGKIIYYHLEWEWPEVGVEVHHRISFFNNPHTDRYLHEWSDRHYGCRVAEGGFYRPDATFDAVYLMIHLYRHLLNEGVGLRQVTDYAMLLQHAKLGAEAKAEILEDVRRMGMMRFAWALMWVIREIFRLDRDLLLCEPDEREGRFLLDEIMLAGNFGSYDTRIDRKLHKSTAGRFWVRTKRRARFVLKYPSEILWDIPYRFYHYTWRRKAPQPPIGGAMKGKR